MDTADEELLQAQQQLSVDRRQVEMERQKINRVYQRLRQRWQKQWAAEKEKHAKLHKKLKAEEEALNERDQALHARETAHAHEVLRFNGERELGLRQLQDERNSLQEDQDRWRKRRSHEMLVLQGMRRRNDETQLNLKKARQLLMDEKTQWDGQLDALRKELYGLNNRILHQRHRIEQQTLEIARLEAQLRERHADVNGAPSASDAVDVARDGTPAPIRDGAGDNSNAGPMPAEDGDRADTLDRLASELADQRIHLLEQFERLAAIQDEWQRMRGLAADDLDALAQRLAEQERTLAERDRQTADREASLEQREQEIAVLRQELLIGRAQLKARGQAFAEESERESLELRKKETLLRDQLDALTQLRRRWNQCRQQELDEITAKRAALDAEKKETQHQRRALFEVQQQLEIDKRSLADKTLALEQYRQEVFLRANDPTAKRRVERLRRRWLTLNAGMIRSAKAERDAAKKEMQQVESERAAQHELSQQLNVTQATLAEQQRQLEERGLVLQAKLVTVQQELDKVHRDRQSADEQALRAREEVEILANVVFTDSDAPLRDQAA
ncbi:MAG: hypothetical protein HYR84_06325 [Planctomycetes bacterium]|nr:hypothetical protein [Planctomycetota bacterium]